VNQLNDVATEKAVLAGMFSYGCDAYLEVSDLISSSTFTDEWNQIAWACVCKALEEKEGLKRLDYPTLLSAAKSLGFGEEFSKPDAIIHLRSLFNFPVLMESVRSLAGVIKKLEFARQALTVIDGVRNGIANMTGHEDITAILADIETPILDISSLLTQNSSGPQKVGKGLREYAKYLGDNKRDVVGIPSGYRWYDIAIGGGFRPGTLNVIGARPKTGKSFLATNIAARVASGAGYEWPKFEPGKAVPVLQLDTEMTKEDQWVRQLSLMSGVRIEDIETGHYESDPYKKRLVEDAISKYEQMPYDFMPIAGQPFEETEAVMRRWITKTVGLNEQGTANDCLIIFDYLKLMDSASMASKNLAEFQVLGFMMTRLHNFAVKYKIPIVIFIQLNREGITAEDTSTASGSDRIIWLCSNFSIYKKKSDEEMAEQVGQKVVWNRKLIPIAARHGAGLDDGNYINVAAHGAIAKIVEGPTRDELGKSGDGGRQQEGFSCEDESQDSVPFAAA
jgi:replicative DNA helicase